MLSKQEGIPRKRKKNLTSAIEERKEKQDYTSAVKGLEKIFDFLQRSRQTVTQLFMHFDSTRDGVLERKEIVDGLLKFTDTSLSHSQIEALLNILDSSGDGVVQLNELEEYIKNFRKLHKEGGFEKVVNASIEKNTDFVFPNWLTSRSDFCALFTRFAKDKDQNESDNERISRLFGRSVDRKLTREDMHLLARWLQSKNILNGLSFQRYLELSPSLKFIEAEPGYIVCRQGEIGDAFYIVFSGNVDIIVDGQHVHRVEAGCGFGERSLETDEPRNATCLCSVTSQLLQVKAHDYKMMIKQHRIKKLKFATEFLQSDCNIVRKWPYSKIFSLSNMLVRRQFNRGDIVFHQGRESIAVYLLLSGQLLAQKKVRFGECSRVFDLKIFQRGDIVGEDLLLGYPCRQYTCIAKTDIDCFVINRKDAVDYFYGSVSEVEKLAAVLYTSQFNLERQKQKEQLYNSIRQRAFGTRYATRLQKN